MKLLEASLFIVFLTITPLRSQTTDGKSDCLDACIHLLIFEMIHLSTYFYQYEKGNKPKCVRPNQLKC